jgi:hypothetical protein
MSMLLQLIVSRMFHYVRDGADSSTCGSWQYGTSAKIEQRIKRSDHQCLRLAETLQKPTRSQAVNVQHAVPTTAYESMPHHWLSENSGEAWHLHMSMWLISRQILSGALRVSGGSSVVYRGRRPLGEPMAASRTINARDDEHKQRSACRHLA